MRTLEDEQERRHEQVLCAAARNAIFEISDFARSINSKNLMK